MEQTQQAHNLKPTPCQRQRDVINGPRREKTCLRWFANNKGADQPAHPRSLISAFVIHLSKSIISRLITSEISIFQLVSEAEETGLKLACRKPRRQVFSQRGPFHRIDVDTTLFDVKCLLRNIAFEVVERLHQYQL